MKIFKIVYDRWIDGLENQVLESYIAAKTVKDVIDIFDNKINRGMAIQYWFHIKELIELGNLIEQSHENL